MEEKAKYQVTSSVNEGILEIVVTGELTDSTYENMTNEMNAIIEANKASKAIADFRAVKERIEPLEMYRYIRNYNAVLFDIQCAIVDLLDNAQYKTAAINAALLKWFTDMDAARKWIKSNERSNLFHNSNVNHQFRQLPSTE